MAKSKKPAPAPADPQILRRKNLDGLATQWGSMKNLAKQLGISPSYGSQLVSGYRPFTEKSARKFEERLGLSIGYFDEARHVKTTPTPAPVDDALMAKIYTLLEVLLEEDKISVSRPKFTELVLMIYEHSLPARQVDEGYVRKLLNLVR